MKKRILALLRKCDTYVSGQEICDRLNISRTVVWKYIHILQEEGYEIETMKKKGYRFIKAPDCLTSAEIISQLSTKVFAQKTIHYKEVDSTNEEAKRLAENGAIHGTLVVADYQTRGKGRRGKTWLSSKDTCIYMSLVLRPDMETQYASGLTLAAALAVSDGIDRLLEEMDERVKCRTKIKWPNDIIINGKKVCGILTEMSGELDYINHVVIGMGINVNDDEFPQEIASMATSLKLESKKTQNRAKLVAYIMEALEEYYLLYRKTNDLSLLLEQYNEKLINVNEKVKLIRRGEEQIRIALGADETGALIVKDENDIEEKIISGEVSVRGVYGYV